MNKLAYRLAAILIVASGAAMIAEIYGQRWAAGNTDELVQQISPGARYGTASYSFWRRRLVVENLALEILPAAATLRVGRVEVRGFVPFLPDLGVGTVESEGVELHTSDGWLLTADRLRLERPQPIASHAPRDGWLGAISAKSLEARGIHAARAQSGEAVAVEAVVADGLAPATIGRIHATRIAATLAHVRPDQSPDRGKVRLQLADIELNQVQLGALGKAVAMIGNGSSAAVGAETSVICDAVVVNGAKLDWDEGSITAARESASRPRLRPFGWPKAAGTGVYAQQVLPLLLPVVQVDHLEAVDIAVAMKEPAPLEGSARHVSIDETGDAASMQVDQFTSAGADGSYMRFASWSSRFGLIPDGLTGDIEFDGLAWGWRETGETSLPHLAAHLATTAEQPFELSLALKALQLPMSLAGELGYAALAFDVQWLGSYDQRRGLFRNRIAVAGRDAGALDLLASLRYVAPNSSKLANAKTVSDVMGYVLATIAGLTIERAEMRYEDASFADHLLAFYATKAGQDKEMFRKGLIDGLKSREPDQSAPPSPERERAAANLAHVAAFLQNPQTLVVTVEPLRPVSWLSLIALGSMAPELQIKFFGLSVK